MRFPGNLAFTYPPLAARRLMALRLLTVTGDEIAFTAVNASLLMAIAWWALGLQCRDVEPMDRERRRRLAWLAAAIGLWREPVNSAIGYGQIDLLITALVLWDLTRAESARGRGTAIGLAAGLKLTPLILVAYLLPAGRVCAARTASLTSAATILAGPFVLPADSRLYWAGAFFNTSRVRGRHDAGGGPADQSLRGALLRIMPGFPHRHAAWLALACTVACLGLTLAAWAQRRGDGAWGFLRTAITGLLISPISWTHRWTLVMPGLLLLVTTTGSRRARTVRMLALAAFTAFSYAIWIVIHEHPLGLYLDGFGEIAGKLYVFAGLSALVAASVRELVSGHIKRPPLATVPAPV